ncbi:MAG: hypothetical protein ABIE23_02225, partial [archaeon]
MKKNIFVLLSIVFLALNAYAPISSQEARNFIVAESNFLEAGDSIEIYPNFPVASGEEKYWVAVISTFDESSGFLAVKYSEKELCLDDSINTDLFATVYILKSIEVYKATPTWLFSNNNAGYFESLGKTLSSNEANDLSIIEGSLSGSEAEQKINSMHSMLNLMEDQSIKLKNKFIYILELENEFMNSTNVNQTDSLKQEYDRATELLNEFELMRIDYETKVKELQSIINKSDLEPGEKQQLGILANPPGDLAKVSSLKSQGDSLGQRINEAYSKAESNKKTWVDNVGVMVKRDEAYNVLYGVDEDLYKKTGQTYNKISDAVSEILSDALRPFWKEQERVNDLRSTWKKAENDFNQKNYKSVESYASRLKNDITIIVEGGFAEEEQPLNEMAFTIAIGLIVLLVVIVIIKNREKIFSIAKGEEEEKVINEWKKI